MRQLQCVHQCYYKHDRQRDIFFPITIFLQQLRTRGDIPCPPSPVSAGSGGAEDARNACLEPKFCYESYGIKLLDLSSKDHVLVSPNTLSLNVHS